MRIVIIEDDFTTRELLAEVFCAAGYEVITYEGKNSIKGIIIKRPDLVLIDNKLRDGFGYELCRDIKNNDLTKHVPVILTSGYGQLENLAKSCGADGYIEKPFDLTALLHMANEFAGRVAIEIHKHEDFG